MAVQVVPYDPSWPSQFEAIKRELQTHLKSVDILSIEHVGSTSVPHLAAKPIIDIDIIVKRDNVQPAADALVRNANFMYLGELGIEDRHAVRDPNQTPPRNIYICVEGAAQLRNHLGLRDTLRANPELRDEYAAVKQRLAAEGTVIVDYLDGKTEVIQKILKAAGLLTDEEIHQIDEANKSYERFGAIKTERLLLREFMLTDDEAYYELESKEEVVRYQTFEPVSRELARQRVADIIKDSAIKPRAHFELVVEHDGIFIGRVGARVRREREDGEPIQPPHVDLWFAFLPEWQGKGFATEAMRAFLPLLGSPRELEIETDPRNEGSWKLAQRLGFERISLTERAFECKGEWVDSLVYRKLV